MQFPATGNCNEFLFYFCEQIHCTSVILLCQHFCCLKKVLTKSLFNICLLNKGLLFQSLIFPCRTPIRREQTVKFVFCSYIVYKNPVSAAQVVPFLMKTVRSDGRGDCSCELLHLNFYPCMISSQFKIMFLLPEIVNF